MKLDCLATDGALFVLLHNAKQCAFMAQRAHAATFFSHRLSPEKLKGRWTLPRWISAWRRLIPTKTQVAYAMSIVVDWDRRKHGTTAPAMREDSLVPFTISAPNLTKGPG